MLTKVALHGSELDKVQRERIGEQVVESSHGVEVEIESIVFVGLKSCVLSKLQVVELVEHGVAHVNLHKLQWQRAVESE